MLKESARKYLAGEKHNCAETVLLAANEVYHLGLGEEDILLIKGFGGGMGCGNVCGGLTGAVAVLSKMFLPGKTKDEAHKITGDFVALFERQFGNTLCSELKPVYQKPEIRCLNLVEQVCAALEAYIEDLRRA